MCVTEHHEQVSGCAMWLFSFINNSSINAVSVKEKLRFSYEEMEIYSNLLHTKERQEIIEVDEAQYRMTGIGF